MVAGVAHWAAGNVDLGAVGWLLVGSIPGVLIGSQFTVRVPESLLRLMLALVLTLSGLQLVGFPGSAIVIPVLLVLGLGGLAVFAFVTRRPRKQAEPARAAET